MLKIAARALLALCLIASANVAQAQSKLFIRSPWSSGYITGPYQTFTTANGAFSVSGNTAGDTLLVVAANYKLQLRVPLGQTLAPGTYDAGEKYSAQVTSRTSMNFYPNDYVDFCSTLSGRFHVLELVRNAQGDVTSLAVNIEVRCNNQPTTYFGQFRYNNALPTHTDSRIPDTVSFSPVVNATPGASFISNQVTISGLDAPIPMTISQGEYSLNGSAYSSAPAVVNNGDTIRMRATAPPNANSVVNAVLDFNGYQPMFSVGTITGTTPPLSSGGLIVLYAQPRYGSLVSKTTVLSPATIRQMRLAKSASNYPDERGIRIESNQVGDPNPYYLLEFYGPAGSTLAPGTYLNVGPSPVGGRSAMLQNNGYSNLLGDFARCDYAATTDATSVTISEIELASDGMPTRLAMDFVTTCLPNSYGPSRLFGHIRYNSTIPIDYTLRLPIPFEFPGVVGAATNTVYVSATGAASGITVPVPVTISGGEYSIGSGAFTSAPGTISNGESIRVRLTSAPTPDTLRTAVLTMGGLEFPFKVGTVTGAAPQPANGPLLVLVSVPRATSQPLQTKVFSAATLDPFVVAKRLYSPAFTVTVSPYQSYNYTWFAEFSGAASTQLVPGNYPQTASYNSNTLPSLYTAYNSDCYPDADPSISMNVAELEYAADGTPTKIAADFAIRCNTNSTMVTQYGHLRFNSTLPIDYTIDMPAPFPFAAQTGLAPGAVVISDEVTMRAMNVPLPISITGGEYSIDGGSFTALPGTIAPGQRLRIRAAASTQSDTALVIPVTVGGRTETFTIATDPGTSPQPHGPPLVVFYSQDYSTGLITAKVISPATLANAFFSPSTYNDARTNVLIDSIPSIPNQYPWQMILAGPGQSLLQVGSYTCNGYNSSATDARCSIYNSNSAALQMPSCYTSSGAGAPRPSNFVVHEIEHSVTGETLRLALDFVDNCLISGTPTSGTSAVFAFIRINSDYPIDHSIRQPIPFYFTTALDAAPSALVVSDEVTIRGINVAVPISIAGGEYSIDGGAFTAASGMISAGQRVRVRATANAAANSVATAVLSIGGISGEFRVGTTAGFPPVANGNPLVYLISQGGELFGGGLTYTFAPVTHTITATRSYFNSVSVETRRLPLPGGEAWSFNFGGPNGTAIVPGVYTAPTPYVDTSGPPMLRVSNPTFYSCSSLAPGSQFTVHEVEYGDIYFGSPITKLAVDFVNYCQGYPDPLYGYIRINSTVAINPIADTVPSNFSFGGLTNVTRGALAISTPVLITGFNLPLPISVSNGEYSIDGAPFTSAPGIINAGQSVRLRVTASPSFGGRVTATLTVGSRSASFEVNSEYQDSYPDEIVFTPVLNAPRSTTVTSPIVTISGTNVVASVEYIQGGEVSVASRPFTNMPTTILPGETLQMRVMTGAQFNAAHNMFAYVGGRPTTFNVQTLSQAVMQVTVTGNGRVDIAPVGMTCTSFCSNLYDSGSQLTLTATPAPGFGFTGWTGAGCAGTGPCVITLALTAQVTATFAALPPGAPVLLQAVAGKGRATLVFAATGTPATGFTATCQPGNISALAAASPLVVNGLTNDTAYQCSVTASSPAGTSAASNSLMVTPTATAPDMLVAVVSRKTHGTAGDVDLPVDTTQPIDGAISIDPRNNSGGHNLVFFFSNPLSSGTVAIADAQGMPIAGANVSTTIADNQLTARIGGLADNIRVLVTATQVNGTLTVPAPIGFLLADVNGSGRVTAADVAAIKARSGANIAGGNNYLFDINLSGQIDAADASQAKASAGRWLP